jgi:endonuclease YncB( thermonuclease family)
VLADYLEGKTVACATRELDQYGRMVTFCSLSGLDIGDWLVRRGPAIDHAYYSKGKYRAVRDEASRVHLAIWLGEFIEPRYFRSWMKTGRLPAVCSTR